MTIMEIFFYSYNKKKKKSTLHDIISHYSGWEFEFLIIMPGNRYKKKKKKFNFHYKNWKFALHNVGINWSLFFCIITSTREFISKGQHIGSRAFFRVPEFPLLSALFS